MQASISKSQKNIGEVGNRRLLFLGSLTAGHMIVHWYQSLLALMLPSIKADFGLTDVQIGTITAARFGANAATTLPSGYLADSYRQWRSLILATAIATFGLAYFLIGSTHTYAWVLVAAGLIGLGTALWHPGATGALSLQFPDHRGFVLAVHGVGASVGDALAPVTVGAIIVMVSWQGTLQFHLIPALVLAFILWRTVGTMYQEPAPKPPFWSYLGDIKILLSNAHVVGILASSNLTNMARFSILTFLPIYVRETLGSSSFVLGIYLSLLYAMGMISQPLMGILSDRLGRKVVIVPSLAAMGLLYLAMAFVPGGIALGFVVGVLGFFFYAILNIQHSALLDVAPDNVQSSTFGIMILFSVPFSLISPPLVGYLVTEFGIEINFWFSAVAMFLATAVLLPIRFRRRIAPVAD